MSTDLADQPTVVFKGGLLYAVPDYTADTARIDRPLPPVPYSPRRPAVTDRAPAGRRGTMIGRAVQGRTTDRLFYLLAAAVLGAAVTALVVLERRWPAELIGGVR